MFGSDDEYSVEYVEGEYRWEKDEFTEDEIIVSIPVENERTLNYEQIDPVEDLKKIGSYFLYAVSAGVLAGGEISANGDLLNQCCQELSILSQYDERIVLGLGALTLGSKSWSRIRSRLSKEED